MLMWVDDYKIQCNIYMLYCALTDGFCTIFFDKQAVPSKKKKRKITFYHIPPVVEGLGEYILTVIEVAQGVKIFKEILHFILC